MANNRMALVCNRCLTGISIAKYYPGTDWNVVENAEVKMDYFLQTHRHGQSEFDGFSMQLEIIAPGTPNPNFEYEHLIDPDTVADVGISSDLGVQAEPGWWNK